MRAQALKAIREQSCVEMRRDESGVIVYLYGDWTIWRLASLRKELDALPLTAGDLGLGLKIDLESLCAFDTAGAWLLARQIAFWRESGVGVSFVDANSEHCILLEEVESHRRKTVPSCAQEKPGSTDRWKGFPQKILASMKKAGAGVLDMIGFLGGVSVAFVSVFLRPSHFRLTSFVYHLDHVGLRAIPIVALMSFLIGCIIAQQAAFQLSRFGAELFVIDMIGVLALREIGMLVAAIMLAGRSGSAFTAEIGAMKMHEEISALRVIGLNPLDVLILPRILALIVSLPVVTFVADIMCLLGGALIMDLYVGISPDVYLDRLREVTNLRIFSVGLIKAPFMALIIGLVACVEGLRVGKSSESLGHHTTLAVVKTLFWVIVLDGCFAVFFALIAW